MAASIVSDTARSARAWAVRAPSASELPTSEARDSQMTSRIFWCFVGAHVLLWSLVPLLTQPNRPLDMVEMLYWGQAWQWGYYKHPPLPAWIAETLFQAFGGATWPLYFAGQLFIASSFWAAWSLAKEFLKPWPALCAAMLLEACVYYNFMTADLNNTIILQPLWALSALWLYRALVSGRLRYWAATGVALGLGMLSKYDMAVLVVAMGLLPVINRPARAALFTAGPYVTLATSLLVFSPHLIWMVDSHFRTVQYVISRAGNARGGWGHLLNPLEFTAAQVIAHLPMLALAYPLWRQRGKSQLSQADDGDLRRDFLLTICLGPFLLDLIVSAATGVKCQSMWGGPLWTFSGLLIVLWIGSTADARTYRTIVFRCALVGCVLMAATIVRGVVLPHFRTKPSRIHYPGAPLAAVVQEQWSQRFAEPLTVIAGPWWTAANVGLHSQQAQSIYDFVSPEQSPWASDADLRARGGVIVWETDETVGIMCAKLVRHRLPEAEILPTFEVAWQTPAAIPPARFTMAIVRPPAGAAQARR